MIPAFPESLTDWDLLHSLLGDDLHPGGAALTGRLLEIARPPPGGVLVDVGAGRGGALREAQRRWPLLRVFGVDPAAPSHGPSGGIAILQGSATEIPQPPASVDVVISECALCLAGSWNPALFEVRRVLRPGGRLVFSDFYAEGPIPRVPDSLGSLTCLSSVRSANEMRNLLEGAGFSGVECHDESNSLLELERRVQSRLDVRGLLLQLARSSTDGPWMELHEFVERGIRARDDGALRYGIFAGTKR